jgi:hypothetical protein
VHDRNQSKAPTRRVAITRPCRKAAAVGRGIDHRPCKSVEPQQELAMIGILDLFLVYCSATAPVCVQVPEKLDPPLTQFAQCEAVGRVGDVDFQHQHPGWRLRAFTCAVKPGIAA